MLVNSSYALCVEKIQRLVICTLKVPPTLYGSRCSRKIDNRHKLKWRLWVRLNPVLIFESNINLNLPFIADSPLDSLTLVLTAEPLVAVIANYWQYWGQHSPQKWNKPVCQVFLILPSPLWPDSCPTWVWMQRELGGWKLKTERTGGWSGVGEDGGGWSNCLSGCGLMALWICCIPRLLQRPITSSWPLLRSIKSRQ